MNKILINLRFGYKPWNATTLECLAWECDPLECLAWECDHFRMPSLGMRPFRVPSLGMRPPPYPALQQLSHALPEGGVGGCYLLSHHGYHLLLNISHRAVYN